LLCNGGGKLDSQRGYTALICAAENGHADCVRLLIDAGADMDARNNVRIGC
jgi:ankyrin repeat protein